MGLYECMDVCDSMTIREPYRLMKEMVQFPLSSNMCRKGSYIANYINNKHMVIEEGTSSLVIMISLLDSNEGLDWMDEMGRF